MNKKENSLGDSVYEDIMRQEDRACIDAIDKAVSAIKEPVCCVCNDTHLMHYRVNEYDPPRKVPCTSCPTPCQECRAGGVGAFCTETPCKCECHK